MRVLQRASVVVMLAVAMTVGGVAAAQTASAAPYKVKHGVVEQRAAAPDVVPLADTRATCSYQYTSARTVVARCAGNDFRSYRVGVSCQAPFEQRFGVWTRPGATTVVSCPPSKRIVGAFVQFAR